MPRVAVLAGDGIGPEIIDAAVAALRAVRPDIDIVEYAFGGTAIRSHGAAFPDETRRGCEDSDAILLGAVGDPRFDGVPLAQRPESALLAIRRHFKLYANLRPVKRLRGPAAGASPLRPEILGDSDILIVRELSSGLYYGEKRSFDDNGTRTATDTLYYNEHEIRRVVDVAFRLAQGRRRMLTSVDKSNVLETSRLWRAIVKETAAHYPDVRVEHMLVDTAAMNIICMPTRFDVMVTENTFGDILSDESAAVTGSIGALSSASLGEMTNSTGASFGLYEPVAGSAPDIAGTDRANPIGAILSAALLLEHSLNDAQSAKTIVEAIDGVLESGIVTADLDVIHPVGTRAFAAAVLRQLRRPVRA